MLRPIPPLAWIPLSILWFGIGDLQNQTIIFLGIFVPILLNTVNGVKGVEPNLVRAARCLGSDGWTVLSRVVLRAGGLPGGDTLRLAAWLALPFVAGVIMGWRFFSRFSDLRFRQFTMVFMLLVAVGVLLS